MTVLEIMIVIAIIGGMAFIVRSGFRLITKADLVENGNELSAIMRRTSQLAVEHGEVHRVLLDLDSHQYIVEVCQGHMAITRNEAVHNDNEEAKRALERGKQRLQDLPSDALAAGDPDEATKRAIAVAGHHIADRQCRPATEGLTGDTSGRGWARKLKSEKGIKFKEVWVQHRDDSATKGQVAVYFFPVGSSEKAVIELTDGTETFSVLVHGLTGRVELRDGPLKDVDNHMLRNAMGDKDADREEKK
ncbi:MAG TPA: hypothetical protein VK427_08445 [Kofleriaceae bacterium]|nr:hypothetical protein [Kofleriaceae bacterium]